MPEADELKRLLSAYLDGELTQADQQRVRIYLEDSEEAREHFRELQQLKEITESIAFAPPPDDRMDELERRLSVRAPRSIGWVFLLIGAIGWAIFVTVAWLKAPEIPPLIKILMGAVALGFALLLASVARQRWLELPHDRYRGVKR